MVGDKARDRQAHHHSEESNGSHYIWTPFVAGQVKLEEEIIVLKSLSSFDCKTQRAKDIESLSLHILILHSTLKKKMKRKRMQIFFKHFLMKLFA